MNTVQSLTDEQLAAWRRDGYLHLSGAFSADEVAAWHAEADRLLASDLVHEDNLRTRFRPLPDGGRIVEKFDPVVDASPVFRAVAEDPRILGPLADLFGEPALLFKDKLIFKPAGADGYGAHQDYTWWQPFPSEKLVSVMVAVDGADATNGGLEVVPERYDRFFLTPGEMRGLTADDLAAHDVADWRLVVTSPGDVLIFHCLTPHRSGRNTSDRSRRQFYPSYAAASYGDLHAMHYEHYRWYVERGLSDEDKARLFFA